MSQKSRNCSRRKNMKQAFTLILLARIASAQSGGQFAVTESLIANGGGNSAFDQYSTGGTAGQPIAGTQSTGGPYRSSAGFWQAPLAPSAAEASVSGRLATIDGRGILNVSITLKNASSGQVFVARSSAFGYYRFDDVPAGGTYILTLRSKRFTFANNPRVISVTDDLSEVDFVAETN